MFTYPFGTLNPNIGALPTEGLIAYYPFLGNPNDQSGNGLDGIVSNAVLATGRKGVPNTAYDFVAASSAKITVAHDVLLDISKVSISMWVYARTQTVTSIEPFSRVFNGASVPYGMRLFADVSNNAGMNMFTAGWKGSDVVGTLPLNQWVYVAGTYDLLNQKLYFNNVLNSSQAQTTAVPVSTSDLRIGSGHAGAFFDGLITDVRLYNRDLSVEEMTQLFNE